MLQTTVLLSLNCSFGIVQSVHIFISSKLAPLPLYALIVHHSIVLHDMVFHTNSFAAIVFAAILSAVMNVLCAFVQNA
jgi:hypothetical protein